MRLFENELGNIKLLRKNLKSLKVVLKLSVLVRSIIFTPFGLNWKVLKVYREERKAKVTQICVMLSQ